LTWVIPHSVMGAGDLHLPKWKHISKRVAKRTAPITATPGRF
jgi:hypothetical protein